MSTATIATSRRRERAPRHARVEVWAGVTLALETAAAAARRERTITRAVRSAWDVLATATAPDSRKAFAAWQAPLGHEGPVEDLFPAVCLAADTPAAVAGSLYRAAAHASGRAAA
jgi:hypothetical protein